MIKRSLASTRRIAVGVVLAVTVLIVGPGAASANVFADDLDPPESRGTVGHDGKGGVWIIGKD